MSSVFPRQQHEPPAHVADQLREGVRPPKKMKVPKMPGDLPRRDGAIVMGLSSIKGNTRLEAACRRSENYWRDHAKKDVLWLFRPFLPAIPSRVSTILLRDRVYITVNRRTRLRALDFCVIADATVSTFECANNC